MLGEISEDNIKKIARGIPGGVLEESLQKLMEETLGELLEISL